MKKLYLPIFFTVCFVVTYVTPSQAVAGGSRYQKFHYDSVQVNPPYDFISLKDLNVYTQLADIENGTGKYTAWNTEGFHVGIETVGCTLEIKQVPDDYVTPKNCNLSFSFIDMYGAKHDSVSDNLTAKFKTLEFVTYSKFTPHISFSHYRGGRYELHARLEPNMFLVTDTIDIQDEACMRVLGDYVRTGADMNVKAYVTTGWPYNPDTLSGNETVRWNIYKMKTDSTFTPVANGSKPINMKNADKSLLAGYDSVNVSRAKPEVGRYRITYESDFKPANRVVYVDVVDTLRATVALDRNEYTCGKDSMALLHIKMDYKYPHISSTKIYPEPTIRINATMNDSKDSLLLSNDTLATKDLMYAGDWTVKFKAVPESELKNGVAHEMMNVTISFNGQQQYAISLPMTFLLATDINQPTADEPNSTPADEYGYNPAGQRVAKGYRGLIIKKGKKYIYR